MNKINRKDGFGTTETDQKGKTRDQAPKMDPMVTGRKLKKKAFPQLAR